VVGAEVIAAQDIQFGVAGQVLILDCEDGRPASVTSVSVYGATSGDATTPEVATTGSAAVETSPNTTLSAAAGAGVNPATLTVASATGIAVGRTYRLTSTTGALEDVAVAYVSGTTVGLRSPLINDYPTGSTLVTCRASIALSTSWVSEAGKLSPACDPNPYWRARWVVVDAAGATQVYDRHFDLVRYPARHGVRPSDVETRFPGWLDSLPIDCRADQGRSLIDRAFRAVRFDLYADGRADQGIRNAELIAELTITRSALLAVEDAVLAGATVDPARLELASRVYRQRYEQTVRAPVAPVDTTGSGASSKGRPALLWRS
jgi:hypothetical protein